MLSASPAAAKPLGAALTGRLVTSALARFVGEEAAAITLERLEIAVADVVPREEPAWLRMHRAAILVTRIYAYLRVAAPGPGWVLAGVEVARGRRRVDLIWATTTFPEAAIAHELKLGTKEIPSASELAQLIAYASASWPEFPGGVDVRLVRLVDPAIAYTVEAVAALRGAA